MDDVTLPRAEWAAVARELASTSRGEEPSGLRHRIDRLLADTPASWADEPRTLWLDPSAATVVRAVVRRRSVSPPVPRASANGNPGAAPPTPAASRSGLAATMPSPPTSARR
jgi:hypothetical protein